MDKGHIYNKVDLYGLQVYSSKFCELRLDKWEVTITQEVFKNKTGLSSIGNTRKAVSIINWKGETEHKKQNSVRAVAVIQMT